MKIGSIVVILYKGSKGYGRVGEVVGDIENNPWRYTVRVGLSSYHYSRVELLELPAGLKSNQLQALRTLLMEEN